MQKAYFISLTLFLCACSKEVVTPETKPSNYLYRMEGLTQEFKVIIHGEDKTSFYEPVDFFPAEALELRDVSYRLDMDGGITATDTKTGKIVLSNWKYYFDKDTLYISSNTTGTLPYALGNAQSFVLARTNYWIRGMSHDSFPNERSFPGYTFRVTESYLRERWKSEFSVMDTIVYYSEYTTLKK